jgi:tetratricopeptide (TPR) repeat protein
MPNDCGVVSRNGVYGRREGLYTIVAGAVALVCLNGCTTGQQAALYRGMARDYLERGDIPTALERAKTAVTLSPDTDSFNVLGAVNTRAGNYDTATYDYDQALALSPGNAEATRGLAEVSHLRDQRDGKASAAEVVSAPAQRADAPPPVDQDDRGRKPAEKSAPSSTASNAKGKPTQDEIVTAVTQLLQSSIPVSWVGNLMGGRNAQVDSVQILREGLYNEQQKYWPFKIRVAGRCQLNDPFNPGKTAAFDREGDFIFFRDDYGDVRAELRGGMFQ